VSVYANTLFAACISSRPCTVCPSLASTRQPHCGPLYTLFPFLTVFHLVTPSSLFLLLSPLPHCSSSCHPFLTVPPLVTPSSLSLLLSPLPHCPSSCHPFLIVPPLVTPSSLSLLLSPFPHCPSPSSPVRASSCPRAPYLVPVLQHDPSLTAPIPATAPRPAATLASSPFAPTGALLCRAR